MPHNILALYLVSLNECKMFVARCLTRLRDTNSRIVSVFALCAVASLFITFQMPKLSCTQWQHIILHELLCVLRINFDTCYGFNIIDIVRLFVIHSFYWRLFRLPQMWILAKNFLNDALRAPCTPLFIHSEVKFCRLFPLFSLCLASKFNELKKGSTS